MASTGRRTGLNCSTAVYVGGSTSGNVSNPSVDQTEDLESKDDHERKYQWHEYSVDRIDEAGID